MGNINQLVLNLKENNQDFELYPTTKEMIRVIYNHVLKMGHGSTWLDIGAGTCNLKKFFKEFRNNDKNELEVQENIWRANKFDNNYRPRLYNKKLPCITEYYVIEKSKILVDKFDEETICIGRDFHTTYLIDKPVHCIFCNPPYSEFKEWMIRIITEGNFSQSAYLVVPQRWKNDEDIQNAITNTKCIVTILDSSDFLHAERQARAKVDIVCIGKPYSYYNNDPKEFNEDAFNKFFDEFFEMRGKERKTEWEIEEERKQEIKNKLTTTSSKALILQQLYDDERQRLLESFKAISQLPTKTLEDIGVDKKKVKDALKFQLKGLKSRYWKLVFEEFSEITDRLTYDTREKLFSKFKNIQTIDFTIENIYPILLWVIKNANKYYDEQLLEWFKKMTSPENIKNYKSNQRVFKLDSYRAKYFDKPKEVTHYVLDYRIIMTSMFICGWRGELETNYNCTTQLQDIFTLANNLGFKVNKNYELPSSFGAEAIIYLENGEEFMRYRAYKNCNMHVKFNLEFMKAVNVECSRLLGWIRDMKDIKETFPDKMAKGAEKYFKHNYTCISDNAVKMIGVNK